MAAGFRFVTLVQSDFFFLEGRNYGEQFAGQSSFVFSVITTKSFPLSFTSFDDLKITRNSILRAKEKAT